MRKAKYDKFGYRRKDARDLVRTQQAIGHWERRAKRRNRLLDPREHTLAERRRHAKRRIVEGRHGYVCPRCSVRKTSLRQWCNGRIVIGAMCRRCADKARRVDSALRIRVAAWKELPFMLLCPGCGEQYLCREERRAQRDANAVSNSETRRAARRARREQRAARRQWCVVYRSLGTYMCRACLNVAKGRAGRPRAERRLAATLSQLPQDMVCPACRVHKPRTSQWCKKARVCLACFRRAGKEADHSDDRTRVASAERGDGAHAL